jgi:hypothetical protein
MDGKSASQEHSNKDQNEGQKQSHVNAEENAHDQTDGHKRWIAELPPLRAKKEAQKQGIQAWRIIPEERRRADRFIGSRVESAQAAKEPQNQTKPDDCKDK